MTSTSVPAGPDFALPRVGLPRVDLSGGDGAEPGASAPQAPWTCRILSLVGLVLLGVGVVIGNPTLVLVAGTASAVALTGRRLPADLAVPVAALALLAAAVVAGTIAGFVGIDLLARPVLLATGYVLGSTVALVRSWRSPRWLGMPGSTGARAATLVPAAVALGTAVLQGCRVGSVQSWAFYGTDLVNHMTLLSQVQQDGRLDYALTPYPRGLHMFGALASVPGAPTADPAALLRYDLKLTGAVAWLALALLVWVCAAVTARLASAVAVPRAVGPVAVALVGGLLLLTNTFLEGFVDQAAAPGLVAVAAILTLLLAALVHPAACTRPVLVLAAAAVTVMLVAHLWQALVLVPAAMVTCALLSVVTDLARYPHRLPHRHPGDGTAAVVVLVAAALAVPPLAQVAAAGGTGLAGQTGSLGAEPWSLLVPGLLAALLLLPRMSRPWARTYVGGMVGLVAVLTVLLRGAGHGVDLEQWYPLKVCWFLTVFLAPWLALTVVRGVATGVRPAWRLLGRARGSAFVLRAAVLSVTGAAALVTWLPWQLGPTPDLVGAWQPYQGPAPGTQGVTRPLFTGGALDLAADNGSRFGTAVPVPFGVEQNFFLDQYSSLIVSKLFSFQNGRPDVAGATDLCDAVRRVAGSDPAVVVTRTDPVTVRRQMAADGCAGRARVVLLTRPY